MGKFPSSDKTGSPREWDETGGSSSAILAFLDSRGVPWRKSAGTMIAECGTQSDRWYEWDIIPIPTRVPLLDGLKVSLRANFDRNLCASVPLIYFSCQVHISDDTDANLAHAASQLEAVLGRGTDSSVSNTRARRWDDGYARIEAITWPRELQFAGLSNPAHKRHPFLAFSCHVSIQMTYLAPWSAQERVWARSFQSLHAVSDDTVLTPSGWEGAQYAREFLRKRHDLPAAGRGLGISSDGTAIITVDSETLNILPLNRLRGCEVVTEPDERGGPTTYRLVVSVPKDFESDLREVEIARRMNDAGELPALAELVRSKLR